MNYLEASFSLTDRNIILTGAAGLLGREFALALGQAGASLHLLDINEDALESLADSLTAQSIKTCQYVIDIREKSQVSSTISEISKLGPIDGLVNSAAIDAKFDVSTATPEGNPTAFINYSLEHWQNSLDVNLTGMFLITQAVCSEIERKATKDCSIINLASTYGLTGPDQRLYENGRPERFFKPVDYSVTKAGVIGFTKALAAYYRETGVRVNCLSPGGAFNNHDAKFSENYAARTIMGRMANPSEYGAAIVFLASAASSYMTGSNLVIDGGWTAL